MPVLFALVLMLIFSPFNALASPEVQPWIRSDCEILSTQAVNLQLLSSPDSQVSVTVGTHAYALGAGKDNWYFAFGSTQDEDFPVIAYGWIHSSSDLGFRGMCGGLQIIPEDILTADGPTMYLGSAKGSIYVDNAATPVEVVCSAGQCAYMYNYQHTLAEQPDLVTCISTLNICINGNGEPQPNPRQLCPWPVLLWDINQTGHLSQQAVSFDIYFCQDHHDGDVVWAHDALDGYAYQAVPLLDYNDRVDIALWNSGDGRLEMAEVYQVQVGDLTVYLGVGALSVPGRYDTSLIGVESNAPELEEALVAAGYEVLPFVGDNMPPASCVAFVVNETSLAYELCRTDDGKMFFADGYKVRVHLFDKDKELPVNVHLVYVPAGEVPHPREVMQNFDSWYSR